MAPSDTSAFDVTTLVKGTVFKISDLQGDNVIDSRPRLFMVDKLVGQSTSVVYKAFPCSDRSESRIKGTFSVLDKEDPVALKLSTSDDKTEDEYAKYARVLKHAEKQGSTEQTDLRRVLLPIQFASNSCEVWVPTGEGPEGYTYKRNPEKAKHAKVLVLPLCMSILEAVQSATVPAHVFFYLKIATKNVLTLTKYANHGDMKPDNLLLPLCWGQDKTSEGKLRTPIEVRIGDFDTLHHISDPAPAPVAITPTYASTTALQGWFKAIVMDPKSQVSVGWSSQEIRELEMLFGGPAAKKGIEADLWALGVSIFTVLGLAHSIHAIASNLLREDKVDHLEKLLTRDKPGGLPAIRRTWGEIEAQLNSISSSLCWWGVSETIEIWWPLLNPLLSRQALPASILGKLYLDAFWDRLADNYCRSTGLSTNTSRQILPGSHTIGHLPSSTKLRKLGVTLPRLLRPK